MPPLTATSKPLEPIALAPSVSVNGHSPSDAWIEKVFGPRERQASVKASQPHKDSRIHRRKPANDSDEEHSYREELAKYIAEATANLSVGDEEPLDDSDDSDEDSSDDDCEQISPCNVIFDCNSEDEDCYVAPPVEVPRSYRTQDLQGGMLVGGDYVLFTNWAFKRQLRRRRRFTPIRERDYESPLSDEENTAKGVYSGKIVEL